MKFYDFLQRLVEVLFVLAVTIPIYKACKASLLEDLARRKKEREEKKKNG